MSACIGYTVKPGWIRTVAEPILRNPPRRDLDGALGTGPAGLAIRRDRAPDGTLGRAAALAELVHEVLVLGVELGLGRRGGSGSAKAAGWAALLEAVSCHVAR